MKEIDRLTETVRDLYKPICDYYSAIVVHRDPDRYVSDRHYRRIVKEDADAYSTKEYVGELIEAMEKIMEATDFYEDMEDE